LTISRGWAILKARFLGFLPFPVFIIQPIHFKFAKSLLPTFDTSMEGLPQFSD